MKDIKELYVDGVETIHLLNATVRMDLFSLQPPQGQEEKPSPRVLERIIMPLQSFLNMHDTMQQIVDKMVDDGLLTPAPQKKNNWDTQE